MVSLEKNALGEEILTLAVDEEYDGRCIKDFLRNRMHISATLLKKVKYGGVTVGEKTVTMRATVMGGDIVKITLPTESSEGIEPVFGNLSIVYEDEHLLVVNKPCNMPIHPSRGNHLTTLANLVMAYMGEEFVFRAVNRLDRDTAGIVIIAKNQYSAGILAEDMKSHGFEKRYTALLSRAPEIGEGVIDAPIERECEGNIKRCVREDGKRSVTEYRVTEVLPDGRAICKVRLHTGRTHQIRVHMAYIGAPLWADFLYGDKIEGESYSLVADELAITHPVSRKRMVFSI